MTEAQLREAIEVVFRYGANKAIQCGSKEKTLIDSFQTLIDLARSYLAASDELPKEKDRNKEFNDNPSAYFLGKVDGHNEALRQATPVVAKLKERIKELERVRGQGVWMSIKSDVSAVVCEAVASTGRKIAEEYLNHLSNKYADKIHALINQEKK